MRRANAAYSPFSTAAFGVNRFLTVFSRWEDDRSGGIGGLLAAELSSVGGQVVNVGVGEERGLDPARHAGLGQQPGHDPRERIDDSGRVALAGPALAEHH